MAKPLPKHIADKHIKKHALQVEVKTAEFVAEKRKPFKLKQDKHGHGPGVVPQKFYDTLRHPSDKHFSGTPEDSAPLKKGGK